MGARDPGGAGRRWRALASLAAAAVLVSPSAAAHGGPLTATGVLIEPGRPEHVVLVSPYWGFAWSEEPSSWEFLCAEAFGGSSYDATRFEAVVAPGGRLVVAVDRDGVALSDDGCDVRRVAAFGSLRVTALALASRTAPELLAVGSRYATDHFEGGLFRSSDGGDTWAAAGTLPTGFSARGVAVAPSDPSRLYVSGRMDPGIAPALARSTDGGVTWDVALVPWQGTSETIRIAGVHPSRPEVVFVHVDGAEGVSTADGDVLFATMDGGDTFAEAFAGQGDVEGFTFTPDGDRALVGGPQVGLQEATIATVEAGASGGFARVFDGKVHGLAYEGGRLFAGTDDAAPRGVPRLLLGVSDDDGRSFTRVMRHCDVTMPACGATSTVERLCRRQFEDEGGFADDQLNEGSCPELHPDAGAPDASTTTPRGPSGASGGCGVSPSRPSTASGYATSCVAGLLAVARAARRRRRLPRAGGAAGRGATLGAGSAVGPVL